MVNCSSGGCVKASVVCDGSHDCPGGSDEVCPKRECDLTKEFECHHTAVGLECLPTDWLCDGDIDCFDATHSDEVNCISVCEETEFPCVTGGQCVPNQAQCDGTHDCQDGSDEYSCDRNTVPIPCHSGFFQCHNGECVGDSQLCDGGRDCEDGTDEHPMWCNESGSGSGTVCTGDSHGCEHYCNDTSHAYHCSCYPGYVLGDDRKCCLDINECEDRSKCSQLCCNKPGSYECRCVDGFHLQKDGSCKPTGPRGYLLLLDKVSVSSIQYGTHSARKVVRDLAQAFAFDYHFRLKRLYWSESDLSRSRHKVCTSRQSC
ncbi:Low-density lipoprotein receptor-related protein 4 [Geodia barretti]|uniref:Low-density lipoprotein receptor-related protein 4 n=2 Tax=Geodia barretti TaxID=519541 RepID=A0AA35XLC1_GEOBA|nr:Low-density lipoprotein receptor-related protein 4 [Geodia barretti]